MSLLDSFLVRATLAGLGVALAAAPLGCFVVWRRMAYVGDATAHASILGVALALAFNLSIFAGVLIVALAMATTIAFLSQKGHAIDALLGVMAHSALAFGLVAVTFLDNVRIDLMAFLFGDILAVGHGDLAVIWIGALLILGLLWWRWSALLTSTLNPDLARAAGIDPARELLGLTVALALIVAVAIKVVGVLLIAALLLIPAATARTMAGTPEGMAAVATGVGAVSALGGMQLAYSFDTPTGPTIVCVAALAFGLASAIQILRHAAASR